MHAGVSRQPEGSFPGDNITFETSAYALPSGEGGGKPGAYGGYGYGYGSYGSYGAYGGYGSGPGSVVNLGSSLAHRVGRVPRLAWK